MPYEVPSSLTYQKRFALSAIESGVLYVAEAELVLSREHKRHGHREWQVLCVIEGAVGMETTPGETWEMTAGTVCNLGPDFRHRVASPRVGRARVLDLRIVDDNAVPVSQAVRLLGSRVAYGDYVGPVAGAIKDLRSAPERTGVERTATVMSAVWTLVAVLASRARTTGVPAATEETGGRLAAAERFMADHLADAIGVEHVAAAVGLSRSQLTRLFGAERGASPAARLREMRVTRARELLAGTTLSIKEVAQLTGFASPHHFSRVFFEVTGERPSGVRG